jgi:hypothetical protein
MPFHYTGVGLRVDFTDSKFIIPGKTDGIGEAVLFSKPNSDKDGRSYIFFLTSHHLVALWSEYQSQLLTSSNISNIDVRVLTQNTTLQDFQNELHSISTDVVTKTPITAFDFLPSNMPLVSGVYFFARVYLDGASDMAKAMRLGLSPGCKPIIALWAQVARNEKATSWSIVLREFGLFGNSVILNGTGMDRPALDPRGQVIA